MAELRFLRVKFNLEFTEMPTIPVYPGATFRGAFGHAFRKLVCAFSTNVECSGNKCVNSSVCPYKLIFAPNTSINKMKDCPCPYILKPEMGNSLPNCVVEVTLFGNIIDYFNYFILTFNEMGKLGIGADRRGKFKIDNIVDSKTNNIIFDSSTGNLLPLDGCAQTISLDNIMDTSQIDNKYDVELEFKTPTRIKSGKPSSLINTPKDVRVFPIFKSIINRLYYMYSLYHDSDKTLDLSQLFPYINDGMSIINNDTSFIGGLSHFSTRQCQLVPIEGFIGKLKIGNVPENIIPLLCAGTVTHVGSNITSGCGCYNITSVNKREQHA